MATITQGTNASFAMPVGNYFTLTTLPNVEGYYTIVPQNSNDGKNVTQSQASFGPPQVAGKQIGPFPVPVTATIYAVKGSVDYVQATVTSGSSDLTALAVAPSATPYTITKATHGNKKVMIAQTVALLEVIVDETGWVDGDRLRIVCANKLGYGFTLRSSSYAKLGQVENRLMRGYGSWIEYAWSGTTNRFEHIAASFVVSGALAGDLSTGAWFGDNVTSSAHYQGPNMDAYFGNGRFLLQANNGGSTYFNSPSLIYNQLSTTVYRIKPGGYPSYGISSQSYMGLDLNYYEGGVGSLLRLMQTSTHSNAGNAQSIAPGIGANGLGERNWLVMAGPGGTIIASPTGSTYNGEYGRVTTSGNLVWARAMGSASEQIDAGTGTHTVTINDGVQDIILNGSGTVTLTMPTISTEEISRDVRVSLTAAYTAINITGTTSNIGTLPLTAGSFFTLRWSPSLAAWHRVG